MKLLISTQLQPASKLSPEALRMSMRRVTPAGGAQAVPHAGLDGLEGCRDTAANGDLDAAPRARRLCGIPDGSKILRAEVTGPTHDAERLGHRLADDLLAQDAGSQRLSQ